MGLIFKRDKRSSCPYESGDILGQIKMDIEIAEWKRKNFTPYDTLMTYLKEVEGYTAERGVLLTHDRNDFVTISHFSKEQTGAIITLTIPEGYELLTCPGTAESAFIKSSYGFCIKAADATGKEIDGTTKLRIENLNPLTMYKSCLDAPYYVEYRNVCGRHGLFNFTKNQVIEKGMQHRWLLIPPKLDVTNVEYYGRWDIWKKG